MSSSSLHQDQLVADYAPLKITSPRKAEESVRHIPTEQCSKSHRTNPVTMKMRRKLTEVDQLWIFFFHGTMLILTYLILSHLGREGGKEASPYNGQ